MKHHTFVCGTSKSKTEDAYYIRAKNRFWRSLCEADITDRQLEPKEYRILGKKYGIYLTDIVDRDSYIIRYDRKIEPFHLKDGLKKLFHKIDEEKPKRIGFTGKNAATWFYRYLNDLELTKSNNPAHKRIRSNLGDYGLLDWKYKNVDYSLLTNTHRDWLPEIWLDFWQRCKYDVDHL